MIKFHCENCGQRISAAEEDAGTQGVCPQCQSSVNVPSPVAVAPAVEVVGAGESAAAVAAAGHRETGMTFPPPPVPVTVPATGLTQAQEDKRGCLLYVAPVLAFAVWMPIALWHMNNPAVPGWLSWVCGAAALFAPFYFMPKRDANESGLRGILKIVCHLLCLPLGFALAFGVMALLHYMRVPGENLLPKLAAIGAFGIALILSKLVDLLLFKPRHRD